MLDCSSALASEVLPFGDSTAATEESLSIDFSESNQRREAWQQLIDFKLVEWGRDPGQLEDVDLIPPTQAAVDRAVRIAMKMQQSGVQPPTSVVPDGDGGVNMERRSGATTESIEIASTGIAEFVLLQNGRVVGRRDFHVGR
ncbi:MAG: hypothetical protein IT449_00760 [Phycisphaerales bacterium]|nr:hypothetical protein [Phycisphaerales bacterium]